MEKMENIKKYIWPHISYNSWSYFINQNNNAMRLTFEGYGSCTPRSVLQEWINRLSQKEIDALADECDKKKDNKD